MLKQFQKYLSQIHNEKIILNHLLNYFDNKTINYILLECHKKTKTSISNLEDLDVMNENFRKEFINNVTLMSREELEDILNIYVKNNSIGKVENKVINKVVTNEVKTKKTKKKSIPLALKKLVWNKYIGEDIGKSKCLCCGLTDILQISFHCGHIVAEIDGGKLSIDNLMPICQNCNSSMGSTNLLEFRQILRGKY
jgi:hypothetical protein